MVHILQLPVDGKEASFFHTSLDRITISSISSDESSFMKEKPVLHECLAFFLASARADSALMTIPMVSMEGRLIVMRGDADRFKIFILSKYYRPLAGQFCTDICKINLIAVSDDQSKGLLSCNRFSSKNFLNINPDPLAACGLARLCLTHHSNLKITAF
ncbi:hypothetical protein TNCT_428091 [Trichonephila clavata]|uniref:Uncharacterized protein n=1 Tax=Trichonephila clavata TaxID=2740835 RepID=A0A8X6KR64_TRICU|nr:hypothetical protein TNCT_428091 [Trichonephila clavata]